MFIKGMKYEFRAIARVLLPLFIAFLCVSMLLSLGYMLDGCVFHFSENETPGELESAFSTVESLLGLGLFGLFIAINVVTFVMVIRRFYTSFFTDEGYLTFTLPLTMDCHLMIKIVSMLLWSILSLVVTSIGLLIIFGGLAVGYTELLKELFSEFQYYFEIIQMYLTTEISAFEIVLAIISLIVDFIFQSILLYFSITLGCMIFKKHRLAGAILLVFCIDRLHAFLSSLCSYLLTGFGSISETASLLAYVTGIIISIIGIIALYCTMKYILERKLNLD